MRLLLLASTQLHMPGFSIPAFRSLSRRSLGIPGFSVPYFSTWYRQSRVPGFSKIPDPGSRVLVDPRKSLIFVRDEEDAQSCPLR